TLVVVLPSFLVVAYTSHLIHRHKNSVVVRGIFTGLRPVVVGLIASAALLLMNAANFGDTTYQVIWSIVLCVGAFVAVYWLKWHPILIICLAGVAGWIVY
ncbi:MAG: chromate transporter, partial [Duncaniella sp.]|nr:chromate transporter [Duncaniella sp.]